VGVCRNGSQGESHSERSEESGLLPWRRSSFAALRMTGIFPARERLYVCLSIHYVRVKRGLQPAIDSRGRAGKMRGAGGARRGF
jgi:hypothetical protein